MRRMGPLAADHPLVGDERCAECGRSTRDVCPACKRPFAEGDYVTLIPVGPGDDKEEQERARKGVAYNALAVPVHWDCAGASATAEIESPVIRRRFTQGVDALSIPIPTKVSDLAEYINTVNAALAAMQSLDDIGPMLNALAWDGIRMLQERREEANRRLKECVK